MNIAFFDVKPHDKKFFIKHNGKNGLVFRFYETRLNEYTAILARGFDAVCVFVNDDINNTVINRLCEYGVKLIALRCAGFNNVDLASAENRISVVRVPSYSPYAIAEHAMALLLCSARRIHKAYSRTRDFNFSLKGLTGFNLSGKTIGIVGTGKIGRVLSDICHGFNMNVIAYDKYPSSDSKIIYVTLEQLLCNSDIISLHCPLTEETYHMISKKSIDMMKKGVILINTSRGALVDSEALLDGIKSRKVGAACLDVYEEESDFFFEDLSGHIMDDDTLARLISMPNVIVTSHQAFLTDEALSAIAEITVQNILDFFSGKIPEGLITI